MAHSKRNPGEMQEFARFVIKPGFFFLMLIADISMKPGFNLACLRNKENNPLIQKKPILVKPGVIHVRALT
jgi:hypothetical protein